MMRYTVGFMHARHEYIVCARRDIARDPGRVHYWVEPCSRVLDTEPTGSPIALFPTISMADEVIALFENTSVDWRVTTRHLEPVGHGSYKIT